jgi:ATP-dependent DNA helicase RecG
MDSALAFPRPLTVYGISDLAEVALLLPLTYRDLRRPATSFAPHALLADSPYLVRGVPAQLNFNPGFGKAPRLTGRLLDGEGHWIGFTLWGDSRDFQATVRRQPDREINLSGVVRVLSAGCYWLDNVVVLADERVGTVESIYPASNKSGRGVNAALCRALVTSVLPDALPLAADKLATALVPDCTMGDLLSRIHAPTQDLESLLLMAHAPATPAEGRRALECVETIAACAAIVAARRTHHAPARGAMTALPSLDALTTHLPFPLTRDQREAACTILADLARPVAMRRVLCGDVGTGKTVVYGLAAAAVAASGGWAAVLVPNSVLVEQVAGVLRACFPGQPVHAVSATDAAVAALSGDSGILVGTTALLFRNLPSLDLVIVDEQHKYSRRQREQLRNTAAHALEVTATCIPRTQALISLELVELSMLRDAPVEKQFETVIWPAEQRGALFRSVRETVASGGQVLALYPLRDGDTNGRLSVHDAATVWERQFPGRVQVMHGGQDDEANIAAAEAMRRGDADILVSTTVAEVGLDLPRLTRVVVVRADRFGLATLHQIRGRVARRGGTGYCDLFLPKTVSDASMARLQALVATQDGFAVAQADLALRGGGDIRAKSDVQKGADKRLVFGHSIGLDVYQMALSLLPSAA